jgi:hypothetical protein
MDVTKKCWQQLEAGFLLVYVFQTRGHLNLFENSPGFSPLFSALIPQPQIFPYSASTVLITQWRNPAVRPESFAERTITMAR